MSVDVFTIPILSKAEATIVQTRASSLTRLKDIDGIGETRIGKYGAAVVGLLTTAPPVQMETAVET